MAANIRNHEAFEGRSDLVKLNPTFIKIEEGWNSRRDMGDLASLARDIATNGVLMPLRVRRDNEDFFLVSGERRLRATMLAIEQGAEIVSVPCVIVRGNEATLKLQDLSTNTGKPLTFAEESREIARLVAWGVKQADLARSLGRDASYVSYRIKFIETAAPAVVEALEEGKINQTQAQRIAAVGEGIEDQERLLADEIASVDSAVNSAVNSVGKKDDSQTELNVGEKKADSKKAAPKKPRRQKDRKPTESEKRAAKKNPRTAMLSYKALVDQIRIAEVHANSEDEETFIGMQGILIGLKIAAGQHAPLIVSGDFDPDFEQK